MFGDCSILFWLVIRKLLCLFFLFFWPPTISRIYFERGALKYVLSPLIWFFREEKKLSRELWTKITKATCRGQMNENIVVNNSKMTLSHFDCVSAKWLIKYNETPKMIAFENFFLHNDNRSKWSKHQWDKGSFVCLLLSQREISL